MNMQNILQKKVNVLANAFDMGKYHECAAMLNVVVAEKDVEGTFAGGKATLGERRYHG